MQQYYWLQPLAPQLWSRSLLISWGAALAVFYFYSFWPEHLNLKTQRGDMEHNRLCHHPGFQRLSPASLRAMQVYTLMLTDKWVAAQRVYRKGDFGKSLGLVFVLTGTWWICQPHFMSLVLISSPSLCPPCSHAAVFLPPAYQLRVCQPPPEVPNADMLMEDGELDIGECGRGETFRFQTWNQIASPKWLLLLIRVSNAFNKCLKSFSLVPPTAPKTCTRDWLETLNCSCCRCGCGSCDRQAVKGLFLLGRTSPLQPLWIRRKIQENALKT